MQNYSLGNLNDKEFEVLVNDLVSRREGIRVDRYKPGKDEGVDGRFFSTNSREVIIQSKHWPDSSFSTLARRLEKDEAKKVKALNPERYIIATSQPLSKANKKKIRDIFHPYILSDDDVIGRENVNDLLDEFPEVERRHYKLWLSSSNVLERMLSSALTGRSEAKRDAIIDAAKRYVVTVNHEQAIQKLESHHSVVITGEAGVGKTTLADQLAHHYVGHGFELCVIEDDISEVEAVYKTSKKQVLYYDDFLGRNYLMAIEGRKDSRILGLIERIERDASKRFILTSRSTVLSQGKIWSDLFGNMKVDKKEYEVTIKSLDPLDRAKILYNHIWFGGLKQEFIEEIREDGRYREISTHRNFNPRLISFITDPDRLAELAPDDYWSYIQSKLNNPRDIWADVYDRQVDEMTRVLINLTVLNGGRVSEVDLSRSFRDRVMRDKLAAPSNVSDNFEKTMRSAVGSTLSRKLNVMFGMVSIELFNPSISDFVLPKLMADRHTISAFLSSLRTVRSIDNFASLLKSGGVSREDFAWVVRDLCGESLNFDAGSEFPNYFWRLSHLALVDLKEHAALKEAGYVTELSRMMDPRFCSGSLELACDVISAIINEKDEEFLTQCLNFASWAIDESGSVDEFHKTGALISLLEKIGVKKVRNIRVRHRNATLGYWKEDIDHLVAEDNILSDFLFDDQYSDARNWAREYICETCGYLDLTEDEVEEIVDGIDFSQVQQDNQQATVESHDANDRPVSRLSGNLFNSPQNAIDDLFDRG